MGRKYKLLTKSRFVRGRNCAKYVWIAHNEPDKVPDPDPSAKHRMEQGTI
ncbi:MAG: hypothetical protein ACE5FT_07935 [Candidatus Nanoarchaeia archaeon]